MFHIFALAAMVLLISPSFSFAETKEIISEGTYNMGDGETPSVAESRALLKAKQIAVEQAGTYVESYSKVKNLSLTQDEIQVLASGLMEVEILDKKRTVVGDGINFWVKIKAKVNPDKMEEMAKRVKEKLVVEDYKSIQEAYKESQKEIAELKKRLLAANNDKSKKIAAAKIKQDEQMFKAQVLFEKGSKHLINEEIDEAIDDFSKVINIYPTKANPYQARGFAYHKKRLYKEAIKDLNKSYSLDPNNFMAYSIRGDSYSKLERYDKAIQDFTRAISINAANVSYYYRRGLSYMYIYETDKAIRDYNTAISLNPNYEDAYYGRGFANVDIGQLGKALEDFTKVLILNPNYVEAYASRGLVYMRLEKKNEAIKDFEKACQMGYAAGCELVQDALKN